MSGVQAAAHHRVLCIEDDPGIAGLIQRRLARAGFDVDIAPDAAGGLARCAEHLYDVVALDFDLPDSTGLEVLRRLRRKPEESPEIVFVTGAGNEEVAVEAIQSGARHYLVKDAAGRFPTIPVDGVLVAPPVAPLRALGASGPPPSLLLGGGFD